MSRFAQSANNFYSTISYERPSTTAIKGRNRIVSTGQSFQPSSTFNNLRPKTGIVLRSASSSFRNTKGKLDILSDQLEVLLEESKVTRTDTRELQLKLNFLKEELNQRGIDPIKIDLGQQLKALQKAVKIRERSDCLKFEALNQTCQALNRNTKDLRGRLNTISDRITEVQNLLGYHGIRQKLKY